MRRIIKTKLGILLLCLILSSVNLSGQNWQMTEVPLTTPWAEEVDPDHVLPEYPRPLMEREEWLNLNGLWEFQRAYEGEALPSRKKLEENILVPFPWESALSGIREQFDTQRAWYRRTFQIPDDWDKERILLQFGAVDWEATVYVNGRCVGTHRGGYDAFYFDITGFLNQKGDQELLLHVWDPGSDKAIATGKQSNDRYANPRGYTYCPSSGIWQTVWIEPVRDKYIQDFHLTPDIDREGITVLLNTPELYNKVEVKAEILDGGKKVAQGSGRINRDFFIELPDSKLWSPGDPFLYDVRLSLLDSTGVLDQVDSYIGMRKISVELEKGLKRIYLNNKFLFMMGPLDQGYWPDGIYTAPTDEALKWDIKMMKEFGYNMVRKHIKVESQRWFYWCDKLGLIVFQDMPSTFKKRTQEEEAQFELELDRMVRTHWNHPSVVNWIIFNEHWGLYDPVRLTENIMALDPSRLVTGNSGIDAGKPDIDYQVGHLIDNHSYRPPNQPYASQIRASVCGEYGAIGYKIKGHIWDVDGPWVHHNYEGLEAATTEYERFIGQIITFQENGLSAAVYTQWTDLENEMNGIYTYDRKLIKLDKERVTKANRSTWEVYRDMPTKNN